MITQDVRVDVARPSESEVVLRDYGRKVVSRVAVECSLGFTDAAYGAMLKAAVAQTGPFCRLPAALSPSAQATPCPVSAL